MAAFDPAERTFVRGEGCALIDSRGRRVFDAISSVWTTIHGHCHPHIAAAIAQQAATLDHATALGAANPAAIALADELSALTGLDRVFFSGDGASAVEVALKIALQYWQNAGRPERRRFVRLSHAYHGDTVGAMSVSDIALFKERFSPVLFESVPYDAASDALAAEDVAAIIVEPAVQAAAGMRIVPPAAYEPLRFLAQTESRPLLIVDEIATGFGRTGSMFAFTALRLRPDVLCLGKGLTGGTLALSATLASQRIYDAFLGDFGAGRHLFHGHSFAANPIACAAALASLELFDREHTLANVASLSEALNDYLAPLASHRAVREIRRAGLMCAIELDPSKLDLEDERSRAWAVADRLYEHGHFTRPLGDAIQLVPPLASSAEELASFCTSLRVVLDESAR